MEQHSHRLFGSWHLLSAQLELADSKERIDLFGPHPVGRVIFAGNGRMAGVMTARNRTPASDATGAAALFGSMTAFSGTFRFEDGAKVVIGCDVAGNPSWVGTEQVRFYEFSGDRLTLTAGPQAHPMYPGRDVYVIIEWQQEV